VGCGGEVLDLMYMVDTVCVGFSTIQDSLTAYKSVEICRILL
jgi:hypothetical protein